MLQQVLLSIIIVFFIVTPNLLLAQEKQEEKADTNTSESSSEKNEDTPSSFRTNRWGIMVTSPLGRISAAYGFIGTSLTYNITSSHQLEATRGIFHSGVSYKYFWNGAEKGTLYLLLANTQSQQMGFKDEKWLSVGGGYHVVNRSPGYERDSVLETFVTTINCPISESHTSGCFLGFHLVRIGLQF